MKCEVCVKCVFCGSFKENVRKIIDRIDSRYKCYPDNDEAYCQTVLAALRTLVHSGYIYEGGSDFWKPTINLDQNISEAIDCLTKEKQYWRERCLLAERLIEDEQAG